MRKSNKLLIVLALSFVIFGIVEAELRPADLSLIHGTIIAILVFMWCHAHASENGISSSSGYRLMAVFLPPIGVPLYFYRFYGFKSGSIKMAKAVAFAIVLLALYDIPFTIINPGTFQPG